MRPIELRRERAGLIDQAGALLEAAQKLGRNMSSEESERFDTLHADAEVLRRQYERIELQEAAQRDLSTLQEEVEDIRGFRGASGDPKESAEVELRTFEHFCRFGIDGMDERQLGIARKSMSAAKLFERNVPEEVAKRAQTVTTTGGGYLIPAGFQSEIDKALAAFGGMRQACRVLPTSTGNPLPWPTVNDTSNTGRLLAINTAVTPTDVAFGQVELNAYKYSSDAVLVPSELLQDSAVPIGELLGDLLSERLGRITNNHLTVGDGSAQPNGIVTAATDSGVNVDISDGLSYANIVDIEHAVDPAYRGMPGTGWMFHDDFLAMVKKLVDGEGRALFRGADAVPGGVDRIMGYPITINQDVPTPTGTNKAVIFGDLKKYIVRIVRPMVLWRLEERYREVDQTGFFAFERLDGDTTRAAAIVYAEMQA